MSAVAGRAPPPRLERLVADIEAAIVSGDPRRQSDLVVRSAEALTRRWSRLAPTEKPGFDHLLAGLLGQVDEAARIAFAGHLAPLRRAPRLTVTRLARDPSARVAGTLLATCPSFDEPWLLDLVAVVGEPHRRAIARRTALGGAVCDALLASGEPSVAAALLGNPGAAIPETALPGLATMALGSEAVALALVAWPGLSDAIRDDLVRLAAGRARADLLAEGIIEAADVEAMLEGVAEGLAAPASPLRVARCTGAASIADTVFGAGPIEAARIARWASLGRIEDALAALARDAGLPVASVVACQDAPDPRALTALVRGLGHPWTLAKTLLRVRPGGLPPWDTLLAAYRLHQETSPRTARRLLRYAAARVALSAFTAFDDEGSGRSP